MMVLWVFTARSAVDFYPLEDWNNLKIFESSALRYPKEHALFYGSEPSSGSFTYDLLTYLLTYLLAPWSTVLLEKLTGVQLVKKFPAFYWTRRSITAVTTAHNLSILSQLDPLHTLTSHFLKIYLNIILPSTPGSPKWSLSLRFSHQNPVYASLLPHTLYMFRPSHSSRFYHPKNIWWGVQIIKLLIM